MERNKEKEEYLEVLWYQREDGEAGLERLRSDIGPGFRREILDELATEGVVRVEGDRVSLTERGLDATRQLIRSHRLAERLVHDVLGVEYEIGACEFEHIVNSDLVDSICTLLGHPRNCPHGMPIPEGECCRQQAQTVESSVIPASQLEVGESARIAHIATNSDHQMHRLENLLVRPGTEVRLHQRYPSVVIECEGSLIAVDDEVASQIQVWVKASRTRAVMPHGRRAGRRGYRHGPMGRGGGRGRHHR